MENQTRWENRSLGQRIFIYAAAPLCVLLLAFLLFSWFKLYPFGDNTVSWCDINQQVIPLLLDFKDILEENGSLFLNMQNAGGMNFWGVSLDPKNRNLSCGKFNGRWENDGLCFYGFCVFSQTISETQ